MNDPTITTVNAALQVGKQGGSPQQVVDSGQAAWFLVSAVVRYKLTERQIVVLARVATLSTRQGRARACLPTLASLARLTGIPENKTRAILEQLVNKKVLIVLDEKGRELRGRDISKHGYFYGIMSNTSFWDAAPRYNFTPELEALERWLMTLRPEEPEPAQRALPIRKETFSEALQSITAQETISPTRGAIPSTIRPRDRSSLCPDAGQVGGGSNRESAGSVADDQPTPLRGCQSPGASAPAPLEAQVQQVAEQVPTSQKGRFQVPHVQQVPESQPPKKGGLAITIPKREVSKPTSQKGRLDEHSTGPLVDSVDPPKKGSLLLHVQTCSGCSDASSKKKQEGANRALSAIEQTEQVRTGGSKGGPSRQAEVEIMARIRELHGEKAYEAWGPYWRKWFRLKPQEVELAMERLIMRLDEPWFVDNRGAWMRDQFERIKAL